MCSPGHTVCEMEEWPLPPVSNSRQSTEGHVSGSNAALDKSVYSIRKRLVFRR